MPSFYRQLQFYSFARDFVKHRNASGTKSIKVSHPYFIRGRADLLRYIQRKTADDRRKKEVQTLRAKVIQLEGNCADDTELKKEVQTLRAKVIQLEGNCAYVLSSLVPLSLSLSLVTVTTTLSICFAHSLTHSLTLSLTLHHTDISAKS